MFLLTDQVVFVDFQVNVGASYVNLDSPETIVFRNSIQTTIVPNIDNPTAGLYVISFTVPTNWSFPDKVSVRLSGSVNGLPAQLTKEVGQVIDYNMLDSISFIEKWAKADEVVTDDSYTRYESGTNSVLITKQVTKSGDVLEIKE